MVQGKNVDDFDHVKNDRMLEEGDLGTPAAEGVNNIKAGGVSEDMQRMMAKLNTPAAAKVTPPPCFSSTPSPLSSAENLSRITESRSHMRT